MARMHVPSPIMEALDPELAGEDFIDKGTAALFASIAAKTTPPEDRTPEQQALLDSAIPYMLDAWDGYNAERQELLNHILQVGANVVTLAGDTHNAWASQLTTDEGNMAGVEFAAGSVSSPGLEDVLGAELAGQLAPFLPLLIDGLAYVDLINRGYLTVSFTMDAVTANWHFVSNIDSTTYTVLEEAFKAYTVKIEDMVLA